MCLKTYIGYKSCYCGVTHGRTHGGVLHGRTHGGVTHGRTHGGMMHGRTHGGVMHGRNHGCMMHGWTNGGVMHCRVHVRRHPWLVHAQCHATQVPCTASRMARSMHDVTHGRVR